MPEKLSEITKIKRKMLTEVAALAFQNQLLAAVDSLPKKLTQDGLTNYRCCEYKERAILAQRIKLALGADLAAHKEQRLSEVAQAMLAAPVEAAEAGPAIAVIEESCDRCPIEKIVVTNACRNCVAHHCLNSCPKNAIEIVANRAYINKERCVECGICVKSCRFGAILELERPCSRSCAAGAIVPGESSTARINYDKCVECGACTVACPFGAIAARSDLLKVIRMLQGPEPVAALVAPSFIGQFGPLVEWGAFRAGLAKLGFAAVVSVACGAAKVAAEEGAEVFHKLQTGAGYVMNSCCPSFKKLVELRFPSLDDKVSGTESPMLKTARMVREEGGSPAMKCVFIGPCLAKKGEAAREGRGAIAAVLTFEELAVMLVASGINLAEFSRESAAQERLPADGVNFCAAGGVGNAIKAELLRQGKVAEGQFRVRSAAGIAQCIELLQQAARNGLEADFVEGMGCAGGCLSGPGTLVEAKAAGRALSRFLAK
ncbi:ferredoxin hydrogenase large subunit [Hydrogenispora ethanolica]|uniref:Ferredoxin hydrogenase large subunit n=1 Tax=Hydrogenispora ethanolica TaxID=1082276 RepID=A0A4V2QDD0_HYDET|nr:monomeric [FeFe] hydrogenase [Hydrogenispora ethanolica]TCL63797.1 ferredoxin hydrogenase large subunit [Hydrogenispora ethanolica]